jgi:hypothetical protein
MAAEKCIQDISSRSYVEAMSRSLLMVHRTVRYPLLSRGEAFWDESVKCTETRFSSSYSQEKSFYRAPACADVA